MYYRLFLLFKNRFSVVICNLRSPYPPIPNGPYKPLFEFITENWRTQQNPDGVVLPDKVAIVDGSNGLQRTFQEYYTTTTGLAGTMFVDMLDNIEDSQSVPTVAIFCPNHVDYLPICLSIALCGAKMTPINPLYTLPELTRVIECSRPTIVIAHVSKLDITLQAMKQSKNIVEHVIVVTDDGGTENATSPYGTIPLNSLRHHTSTRYSSAPNLKDTTDTYPCNIPYSSGTTGLPKGVCLTHASLVANLLQTYIMERDVFLPHHKLICPLPFYHMYAYAVSMLYTAWQGQTIITTSSRFDLEQFCSLVEQYQPERAHLVPPIIIGLGKSPVVEKYNLSSLQIIVSAAAPLSSETELAAQNRIGENCRIKQFWGMSETSPIGMMNADHNIKSGSVGPLVASTMGKIIHPETGKSLGPNQSGEFVLKGPQVMMGYYEDIDKTAECMSDSGWLRTGDVAHYDDDGYFYITDRIKEIIKVNGLQVAPAELESLLLTHPKVADVAVISIPDEQCGELPRAYIVLKEPIRNAGSPHESSLIYEKEIYDWVKERVAPYKRLKGGIVFTSTIPKSASGKILRRILKDEYDTTLPRLSEA
jgi:4-coumarate--CoA ligase